MNIEPSKPVFTDPLAWTPDARATFAYEQGQIFFQHQQQARQKHHFLAALARATEIFPHGVDEQCSFVDGYAAALKRRSN